MGQLGPVARTGFGVLSHPKARRPTLRHFYPKLFLLGSSAV
jgi:hypothetical protein